MSSILVVGSAHQIDDLKELEEFKDVARKIGQKLAQSKFRVIVCSTSARTFDYYVLVGMGEIEGPHEVELFVPEAEYHDGPPALPEELAKSPNLKFKQTIARGGWRPTHLRAIRAADLVLAVGGAGLGTGSVIYSAEALEKAVLVVRTFKGATREAWKDFNHYYTDPEKNTLSQSTPVPQEWPTSLVDLCGTFLDRNPMRRSRPMLAVLASVLAVMLIATWLWLVVVQPWSPMLYIAAIASVSALIGVLLQQSISRQEVDLSAVAWGLVQGVGIAFSLVIFATTLVGDEFLKLIAEVDRTSISIRFSCVALAAGLVRPEFLKWVVKRARAVFE